MARKTWTVGEMTLLRSLRADGASVSLCSRILGRSTDSIKARLKLAAIRVKPRPWSAEQIQLLVSSYPQRGSSVAAELGRSKHAVRKKAFELGCSYTPDVS